MQMKIDLNVKNLFFQKPLFHIASISAVQLLSDAKYLPVQTSTAPPESYIQHISSAK